MRSRQNLAHRRREAKGPQRKIFAYSLRLCVFACAVCLLGCGASEIKPVDIYPEDMCSHCRMAISDQAFAAEIVAASGEIFKFDEIGCMERFQEKNGGLEIAATFVKDYATKTWLPLERSVIIQTSLKTPMGSGKIALADSVKAAAYLGQWPANK